MQKMIMCDWSMCQRRATWRAYLDNLSFCPEHSYQWQRETTGYGGMMDESMAKNKAALEKIVGKL